MRFKLFLLFIGAASLLAVWTSSANAAAYPNRPITMIVAYSAGGGTDVVARTIVPYLEQALGQSITVRNIPGAGGELGFTAIANAKPDGYTIGFTNMPTIVSIPIQRKTRFSLEQIAPIANIVDDPSALSVCFDSKIKTVKDLVAYAQAHPGEVTYGTTGVGSDDHLAALAFEKAANIQMRHIPFSGTANVRAALLGGHIMLGSMNLSESVPFENNKKICILGHMGHKRWDKSPAVKTFEEQGYPVFSGATRGLGAPAGTPSEILTILSDATKKAVENSDFQAQAEKLNLPLSYLNTQDYTKALKDLRSQLTDLWESMPWAEKN